MKSVWRSIKRKFEVVKEASSSKWLKIIHVWLPSPKSGLQLQQPVLSGRDLEQFTITIMSGSLQVDGDSRLYAEYQISIRSNTPILLQTYTWIIVRTVHDLQMFRRKIRQLLSKDSHTKSLKAHIERLSFPKVQSYLAKKDTVHINDYGSEYQAFLRHVLFLLAAYFHEHHPSVSYPLRQVLCEFFLPAISAKRVSTSPVPSSPTSPIVLLETKQHSTMTTA